MAITSVEESADHRTRTAVYALSALGCMVAGVFLYVFLTRPPQMGANEQVFHTVDALYTAVRNHDERRLAQCQQRLKSYRDEGKLPRAAADSLDGIVRRARSGYWQSAAEELYRFMLAQRREGAEGETAGAGHPPPKTKATRESKKRG